jgi:meso-butanediol dehydrogenase/(S,S)-butanediol dehydrogenase/diacetyl reductase
MKGMSLQGKVALVTGGGRGIGRGIALQLARAGADVAVADLSETNAQAVAGEVRALGRRATAVRADVTDWADAQAMVAHTVAELGSLDIAVNNAGVISIAPVAELTEEAFDRVMAVNVKGVFLSCKAELPVMQERGWGRIVNVASVAGKNGYPGLAHYCASKFAVIGFTNSLAKEVALQGITVNAICPGIIGTDMWRGEQGMAESLRQPGESAEQAWVRSLTEFIPQGVAQTPEDMGDLAVCFATAEHVTGQAFNVNGGMSL